MAKKTKKNETEEVKNDPKTITITDEIKENNRKILSEVQPGDLFFEREFNEGELLGTDHGIFVRNAPGEEYGTEQEMMFFFWHTAFGETQMHPYPPNNFIERTRLVKLRDNVILAINLDEPGKFEEAGIQDDVTL